MVRRALVPLLLAVAAVAAACLVPAGQAGANVAGVVVGDSFFSPAQRTVTAGDTVIFSRAQNSTLAHSVTSDTGLFDQEVGDQQHPIGLRFLQPGTYAYHCKYHSQMHGTLVFT